MNFLQKANTWPGYMCELWKGSPLAESMIPMLESNIEIQDNWSFEFDGFDKSVYHLLVFAANNSLGYSPLPELSTKTTSTRGSLTWKRKSI